jgi:hypothetical protein
LITELSIYQFLTSADWVGAGLIAWALTRAVT